MKKWLEKRERDKIGWEPLHYLLPSRPPIHMLQAFNESEYHDYAPSLSSFMQCKQFQFAVFDCIVILLNLV